MSEEKLYSLEIWINGDPKNVISTAKIYTEDEHREKLGLDLKYYFFDVEPSVEGKVEKVMIPKAVLQNSVIFIRE